MAAVFVILANNFFFCKRIFTSNVFVRNLITAGVLSTVISEPTLISWVC